MSCRETDRFGVCVCVCLCQQIFSAKFRRESDSNEQDILCSNKRIGKNSIPCVSTAFSS